MYCSSCRQFIGPGERYCSSCGVPLKTNREKDYMVKLKFYVISGCLLFVLLVLVVALPESRIPAGSPTAVTEGFIQAMSRGDIEKMLGYIDPVQKGSFQEQLFSYLGGAFQEMFAKIKFDYILGSETINEDRAWVEVTFRVYNDRGGYEEATNYVYLVQRENRWYLSWESFNPLGGLLNH